MIEQFVDHLSADDRARLNRFLSHTKTTLEEIFRGEVEGQLRQAVLWERSQELKRIELSHSEIQAVALKYRELSVRTLALHQLNGRKIGWSAAEECLGRMSNEGLATACQGGEREGGMYRIKRTAHIYLAVNNA